MTPYEMDAAFKRGNMVRITHLHTGTVKYVKGFLPSSDNSENLRVAFGNYADTGIAWDLKLCTFTEMTLKDAVCDFVQNGGKVFDALSGFLVSQLGEVN